MPLRHPTSRRESDRHRPPRTNPIPNPQVGIWWDNGKIIATIAHPATENTTRTGSRLDSNLSHAAEWGQVARKLGGTTEDEYFSVPRGRVLLDVDSLTGVILHGPATKPKRLALIAKRFGLANWRAELDLTADDADRLFEEG